MGEMVDFTRLVGARFTRARSRVSVAEAVGCSASYYADMEQGFKSANPYIEKIADTLSYPVDFFFRAPLVQPTSESFSYRRKTSMKAADRHNVEGIGSVFAGSLTELVQSYVRVPEPDVPDLGAIADCEDPLKAAEATSAIVREIFNMGSAPLRNAIDLVESMGVRVFWVDACPEFDGVSFWIGGVPYILLNRNVKDGYRVRFTVLHELGHLLLHRGASEPTKQMDRQADAFASAMLMPKATFARTISARFDPYSLISDRAIWGASARAQVRRAHDLGIYSSWVYRDAHVRMHKLWGPREPKPIEPEVSRIHAFFFEEAGDRNRNAFDLAEEAALPYDLFLAGMPMAAKYERRLTVSEAITGI